MARFGYKYTRHMRVLFKHAHTGHIKKMTPKLHIITINEFFISINRYEIGISLVRKSFTTHIPAACEDFTPLKSRRALQVYAVSI